MICIRRIWGSAFENDIYNGMRESGMDKELWKYDEFVTEFSAIPPGSSVLGWPFCVLARGGPLHPCVFLSLEVSCPERGMTLMW